MIQIKSVVNFMDIKLEILAGAIADTINSLIKNICIDTNDVINSTALTVLMEIRNVIRNVKIEDDFDVVEEIVLIFEKYNIDAGSRHDF